MDNFRSCAVHSMSQSHADTGEVPSLESVPLRSNQLIKHGANRLAHASWQKCPLPSCMLRLQRCSNLTELRLWSHQRLGNTWFGPPSPCCSVIRVYSKRSRMASSCISKIPGLRKPPATPNSSKPDWHTCFKTI